MGHFFPKRRGSQALLRFPVWVAGVMGSVGPFGAERRGRLGEPLWFRYWEFNKCQWLLLLKPPPCLPQRMRYAVRLRLDSSCRYLMAGPGSSSEDEGGPHSSSSGDEAPKLTRKVRCLPPGWERVSWEEDVGLLWSPHSTLAS